MIFQEMGENRDEIYAMWQRNFHDPVPYADFYFDEVYGKNEILLNISEKVMKGMLHLNPYDIMINGDSARAHYIVGVATDEEYRRQGVMKELLEDTFARLRKQGEAFTYLMPADENYYLPFDFRFGMNQVEQEMEGFGQAADQEKDGRYHFVKGLPADLEDACKIENAVKMTTFAIHTSITPVYLRRLEKETRSDYAKLITVYKAGTYAGRFVVGAENDYMVLSQVFCAEKDCRKDFLYAALDYCEQEYHYGKYQLVLDESWDDVVRKAGNYEGVRVLPVRKKPIIMFRILNLETLGKYLRFDHISEDGPETLTCRFRVRDAFLKEQDGIYLWKAGVDGSCI
ncbi:MAG: GNAT family N-acetyltransferase [Clostridiales bacterium]|nr:GNAT family N-acetyltransferase [Clostridiales bacterium]